MNLSTTEFMNIGTTILLGAAIWRQIIIAIDIEWKNPDWSIDKYKILFPICNFLLLAFMWLPYLNKVAWSALCMLAAAIIVFYTYWSPIFKRKK